MALFGLSACGAGEDRPSEPILARDSAGIRIVENVEPRWGPADGWVVSDGPVWTLARNGAQPDVTFGRIDGVARLSDGRVVVGDGLSGELYYLSEAGTLLHTVGGMGDGPEEFRSIGGVHAGPGDSVHVFDGFRQRIVVLSPAGEIARTATIGSDLQTPVAVAVGWQQDGSLVLRGTPDPPPPGFGPGPISAPLYTVGADGVEVDRSGDAAFGHFANDAEGMGVPIFPRPTGFSAALEGHTWNSSPTEPELRRLTAWGELLEIVRIDVPDLTMAPRVREELVAAQRDRLRQAGISGMPEAVILEEVPPIAGMVADPRGYLWIQRAAEPSEPLDPETWLVATGPAGSDEWVIVSVEGEWLGSVHLPPRMDLRAVGEGFVVGVTRDSLGTEEPVVHALDRGGDAPPEG